MAAITLFWSYAHSDDKADGGRVLRLAEDISDQYMSITGDEVELFVDRKSLDWGDIWRERIAGALTASTFLVAILSPTYFKRPECRREMLDFHTEAESRGLQKLLLPILYVEVEDFGEENEDELVALAARSQYAPWTDLRFTDRASEGYRRAVHGLAKRVVELVKAMQAAEITLQQDRAGSLQPAEYGFGEALAGIEQRLPKWVEVVERDPVGIAQYRAASQVYNERLKRAAPTARIAIRHQYATDVFDLASKGTEYARQYSAASIDMAPYVAAAIRIARDAPSAAEALRPLYEAVAFAREQMDFDLDTDNWMDSSEYWAEFEHLGGIFKRIADQHRVSSRYRDEGNALTSEWYAELSEFMPADAETVELPGGSAADEQ